MALMCEICGKRPAELIVGENRPDSTRTLHLCGYCAAGKGIRVRVDLSQDPRQLWRRFLSSHLKEAEGPQAVLEGHDNDAVRGQARPVVHPHPGLEVHVPGVARDEGTAVNPDHNR